LGAVEAMAKKAIAAADHKTDSANFAEFLLSGTGSKATARIGESLFRIEG
jgi:hypothetical protein